MPLSTRDRARVVVSKRAEHEPGDTWDGAQLALRLSGPLMPLARDVQTRRGRGDRLTVDLTNVLHARGQPAAIEIVLHVAGAAMHRPQLVPHGRASRGVLVDDELIDEGSTNPVAPVNRRVSKGRTEHIAARDADTELATVVRERIPQLRQKLRQILA